MLIVLCMLNLYTGVMFFQFTRIRLFSQTGSAFLTSHQQEWLEMVNVLARIRPKEKPKDVRSKHRLQVLKLCESKYFEYFMLTMIVINMGFLSAVFYDQPKAWGHVSAHTHTQLLFLKLPVLALTRIYTHHFSNYHMHTNI